MNSKGMAGAQAVCALAIAVPFLFPWTGGPSPNTWQLLATFACTVVLAFVTTSRPGPWPRRRLLAWLGTGFAAIAIFRSPSGDAWLPACACVLAIAAAAVAGSRMSGSLPTFGAFAFALLAAGLVSAVLGILQYYDLAEPLSPWTTSPGLGQAYGNLRQRNQFATLLSLSFVALLWLYATRPADSKRTKRALIAAAALLLVAQAAATSRTGLLQLVSIVVVSAWMARRDARLPPPLLLLAAIPLYFAIAWWLPQLAAGGSGAVEGMLQRLREGAPTGHSRLLLWRNVLELVAEHPWAGWGWGELSYAHYSTLYQGPRFVEILDNAHSLPLHLAVELGIPAAVLISVGFLWLVIPARPWAERDPARLMAWGVLAMIVLHSLLEYPLWYGPFQLVFGVCLGMLWPAPTSKSFRPNRAAAPVLSAVAAIVLMATIGYAAWDYTRISQLYLAEEDRSPAWRDDTLEKVRGSRLFASQVSFAELTLTPVTRANAEEVYRRATRLLHFSPEPRVIVKLIESATLLGHQDEAFAQAARFRLAYPVDYGRWLAGQPIDEPPQ